MHRCNDANQNDLQFKTIVLLEVVVLVHVLKSKLTEKI
jgi:hypothetical protein